MFKFKFCKDLGLVSPCFSPNDSDLFLSQMPLFEVISETKKFKT